MSNASIATAKSGLSTNASALTLAGRVLLSIIFILAGFAKLTAISGTAGWFASIGLPLPTVTTVVVGLVEVVGGIAILVGFQTRIAAIVLGLFTLAATAVAHLDFADQVQVMFLQKNLAIAGGLFVLAAFGAGALSIDGRRR
ncbi:DoxX family protein [Aminobacter sp. NyZ550]|jgi:putative oxidoreductase|uniref:DoxX family protein n=2 Tax=Aminobacter TaxID=31988 RepID=A0AAC9ASB7_AMIAI|nr:MULTISPECIES: DoxX family protein [Aminobacter]AMS43141.1 DoxX family protein [Aminobacter aminovorans]MBA8905454.1 putative oxidoreductase [Aminobacter ciceronei]MBA9019246.1 putative oxidoreductase [Aminobacter ciceronei]MBB3708576.1 putative oxidoreductase [Aminobacter aminovorans]WAX94109.1 DoxX family protein [Aminobacter sp. NyZ550]